MLAPIPEEVDVTQVWLVNYWAEKFGITPQRLIQAIGVAGPKVSKLKKYLKEGYRIVVRDEAGVARQIMRITLENGGFAASVPYFSGKEGLVSSFPVRYDAKLIKVPISDMEFHTVSDVVKLSMHMDGFVQFSTGGQKKILSGYNQQLDVIKGVGLKAPQAVTVTTGPLFGVLMQGLHEFELHTGKPAEIFEEGDFWRHPEYSTPADVAYHMEIFMLPTEILGSARLVDGRRIITLELPFKSLFRFPFDLRVIELPAMPFFLGVIVSRMRADKDVTSGYKLIGPGCGPSDDQKRSICAQYPRPIFMEKIKPSSLDYTADDKKSGEEPSPLPAS